MENRISLLLVITALFFATSCEKKQLLLTVKNSSYSIDSLNLEILVNDSSYINTIIDNDSIDHSFQEFLLDVPDGENEITIFSSNAFGQKKHTKKFKFPDQHHLSITYFYHKILSGKDTTIIDSPRWDLHWIDK